jgi:hypothetical protein
LSSTTSPLQEAIDGSPEGAAIPNLPDAQQEFASGLDMDLKRLTQQIQTEASSSTKTRTKTRRS